MTRYRDDDDDDREQPSTVPDRKSRSSLTHSDASELIRRKADELLTVQQEKIAKFFVEKERRSADRARYEAQKIKRDNELVEKIDDLAERVSDLYTRDAYDVGALQRLERELRDAMSEIDSFKGDMLKELRTLSEERSKMAGRIEGIRWVVVGAAGVAGVVGPIVAWLVSKIH